MVNIQSDYFKWDTQGTIVEPISIDKFDINRYHDYALSLEENCSSFWKKRRGVAIYRRFRVPQIFSFGCRNIEESLELQLGALEKSMNYKSDIPNFLEPWYGIGTIASSFGIDYIWNEGQAPATKPPFNSIEEALQYNYLPVEKTEIGKHTLNMIEFFMEKTKGKIPISFADTQAPLNIASYLIPMDRLFLEMYDNPEKYEKLLNIITDLLINFSFKQQEIIGDMLVYPGHGFASSTKFQGIGLSDDNSMMISRDFFEKFEKPSREKIGSSFGGCAFHSCGNWSSKIPSVKKINGLVMVDAAFSKETDPDPNEPEPFAIGFSGTDIVVNARVVGSMQVIEDIVKRIWNPEMKLIIVTYCQEAAEQEKVYNLIHDICN